ncbi:hypothetical protein BDC45DRAFT_574870 [Circinella umbellata]|nr:hypothetical protein BDC45DRAFT_574870 [Circinella umbellata]
MAAEVQSSTQKRTAESALRLSVLKVPRMEQKAAVVRNSNNIINALNMRFNTTRLPFSSTSQQQQIMLYIL